MVFVCPVGSPDGGIAGLEEVIAALLHQFFQFRRIGLVHQVPPGCPVKGDDAVPVGNGGNMAGGGADGFAHLGGEFLQVPHGGILPEDHSPVLFRIDLQRVALADAQGAADLLGDDDPAQIVCLCQSGAKNFCEVPKSIENTGFFSIWDYHKAEQSDQ